MLLPAVQKQEIKNFDENKITCAYASGAAEYIHCRLKVLPPIVEVVGCMRGSLRGKEKKESFPFHDLSLLTVLSRCHISLSAGDEGRKRVQLEMVVPRNKS